MAARLLLALALLAPAPSLAQAPDEFVDPAAAEPARPRRAEVPPPRVPVRNEPSPLDPPRQSERWELGGSVFLFYPLIDDGFGAIFRARVTYRFDAPLMVRAELSPLGASTGRTGRGAGAFALLWGGLDLHAFGASFGLGAASFNEHDANDTLGTEPQPGAMTVAAVAFRIGVSDGLAMWLRAGLGIDHDRSAVEPALFELWGQIPMSDVWAMRVLTSWTMSGNAEARVGVRAWLLGRGEAGSVALLLDGGLGRVVYHPPVRGRGYPDNIDHLGPGFGFGVEGRL